MRFTQLYEELTFSDVFTSASKEEVKERKKKYREMKVKEALENAKKTKLPDGSWHVHGDLDLRECNLTTLININVSKIDGGFDCSQNKLISLVGAPKEIGTYFYCYKNRLISLEGAPNKVGKDFYCYDNKRKFTNREVREISDVNGSIIT